LPTTAEQGFPEVATGDVGMAKQENVINPSSPEAAVQFFRSEQERYARLVKKAGITPE